jgi:ribosomal protein L7/L12
MVYLGVALGLCVAVTLAWRLANYDAPATGPRRSLGGTSVPPQSETGVRQLLETGKKIEAIKLLRQIRHIGLKEAKDAVDEMERSGRLPPAAPGVPGRLPAAPIADAEVRRLVDSGDLIGAIRRYRELTGVGLVEAKAAVDRLAAGR